MLRCAAVVLLLQHEGGVPRLQPAHRPAARALHLPAQPAVGHGPAQPHHLAAARGGPRHQSRGPAARPQPTAHRAPRAGPAAQPPVPVTVRQRPARAARGDGRPRAPRDAHGAGQPGPGHAALVPHPAGRLADRVRGRRHRHRRRAAGPAAPAARHLPPSREPPQHRRRASLEDVRGQECGATQHPGGAEGAAAVRRPTMRPMYGPVFWRRSGGTDLGDPAVQPRRAAAGQLLFAGLPTLAHRHPAQSQKSTQGQRFRRRHRPRRSSRGASLACRFLERKSSPSGSRRWRGRPPAVLS